MIKRLVSFVVLIVLASAIPANAQAIRWGYIPQTPEGWYYLVNGDQVGMLTADNIGMVRGLTNQLRRAEIRSLSESLMWNGTAYGVNTARGFHPMYDRDRRPLTGRQRIERGAGIVLAVDGVRRAIANPRSPWGWVEAAVGGVLVNDSRYRGADAPRPSGPPTYWRNGNPIVSLPEEGDGYRGVSRPAVNGGQWVIKNLTGLKGELWNGEENLSETVLGGLFEPGAVFLGPNPVGTGYRLVILQPNDMGTLSFRDADRKGTPDGWKFLAPLVP